MAVRNAITPSKKTFRVKFPSRKNKCMIHCESMLERDTARLLELSPYVKSYAAQPTTEVYYDVDGEPHRYVPDFKAVLLDDSVVHVEVKPESRLWDPGVKSKLESIFARYREQGRRFRVITDSLVRAEPLHSNLKLLTSHSRSRLAGSKIRQFKRRLREAVFTTVADAAAILGGESQVFWLIATGFLAANLHQPLKSTSAVWIRELKEGDENDPLRI
jgi:hypothetical protein